MKPDIYPDLPESEYHARPELSASNAIKMLPIFGGCPALLDYARSHPEEPKAHYDFGKVTHRLVLGEGEEFEVIDAPDWRTKAAKEARDNARESGLVPILAGDFEKSAAMAAALHRHPFAGACFRNGTAEPSLFWRDDDTGVQCRARLDYMPTRGTVFADFKTCASAHPDDCAKAINNFGYYLKAAWYLDGIRKLGLCERPAFAFVFQEKEPPYLVTVVQPHPDAVAWGEIVMRKARATFAECRRTNHWPGYADNDVIALDLPAYAQKRLQQASEAGDFEIAADFQRPFAAE